MEEGDDSGTLRTREPPAAASGASLSETSEAWFQSVVEAANEGIWIIDLDGRTLFANQRMADMLGTRTQDMIGKTPFDYLFEEDFERARGVMSSNFEGEPVEFEIRFRRADGGEIPVLAGSAPLRDGGGHITGSIATFSDLTARKAAEDASARTTAQFQALADNIPSLCWMAHPDGHIYWYNKRWYDYTGTSPGSQEGWGWESVHDPGALPTVVARWRASLESGTPFEMTFPLRGADGEYRPFLTRVVPVRDGNGRITRWFGNNTDVAALHQAQDDLSASRERLAQQIAELNALYDSAPIGLAFFSRDYRYLRINNELAQINGLPVDQHIGRTIREVLGEEAPKVEPIIDRIFQTGHPIRDLEVSGTTPLEPSLVRHWLTGFYPVKGSGGSVDAVGAWVVEISERKRAEERELLLAREVDHRAKNLLAVVQSIVQLTPAEDGADLKASVVGRIQALARAHSLLSDARWDGVDLGQLVEEELAPFGAGRVSQTGPQLLLRPSAAQSLALVLHELATNAAKYGALSDSAGRLAVEWRRDRDEQGAYLQILWTETGGPSPGKPELTGFGSKIIRASVDRQLRGKVSKEWLPDGLRCTIRIPAAELVQAGETGAADPARV